MKEKLKKWILKLIREELDKLEYANAVLKNRIEKLEEELEIRENEKLRFYSFDEYRAEYKRSLNRKVGDFDD